ncbi:MAG: hypothetical protein KDD19_27210 [Phaeodactylibacter sp.]|nr:hypothetical protein [Phaeodactylibacter sp.]MCB9051438.1 hypothetical protein [Lewinellaceae bacterium]
MKQVLLLFCLITLSGFIYGQDKAAQWREDINYLENELPKRHKDLYRHYSEQAFRAALDSLRSAVPDMQDWQITLQLQEIICRAEDAHTAVYRGNAGDNEQVFPLQFYWFKEGLFVTGASSSFSLDTLLAKQLMAINGIPIERVIAQLTRLFVAENESIVRHLAPNLIAQYYPLRYCGIVDTTSAIFSFRDTLGRTLNLPLQAIPARSLKSTLVNYKPDSYAFTWRDNRTPFWHEYKEEGQVLYIRYNRCTSREMEKKYGNKHRAKQLPSFEKFGEEVLRILEKYPVKKLVFDVSNNPGGSSLQGTELAKKAGKAFNGQAYVIIGRRTFSSAVLNTLDFQKYCNATLVGESTSGRPNHFGEVKTMQLPNSGVTVYYSTQYFKKVEGDPPTIEPDVHIELSFSEFRQGIDPAWEYIKGL